MGDSVCIGVVVPANPPQLADTLRFLRAHTEPGTRVVLVPDGADQVTADALAHEPDLAAYEQWSTPVPRGGAAAFNRLAEASKADIVVLLESGALVGPRWLELLRSALARPSCGLAGPSTNHCWNEQAIAPFARSDEISVRREAALAMRRFGHAARTLEPLYSLAEFCYAVRREVIDTLGPADEGYGVGPCWEMDYNVRAARAGFHGVWVGASYVYRSGPDNGRRLDPAHLDAARRRYQDRLCGLRLRGETADYRVHCEGDRCEHFAPDGLLPPLPAKPAGNRPSLPITAVGNDPDRRAQGPVAGGQARAESIRAAEPATAQPATAQPATAQPATAQPATAEPRYAVHAAVPLVTAIMPTRSRPDFARQAIHYFRAQDYPNAELVIVENGQPALAAELYDDPRIRLVPSAAPASIGALRNLACQHARGDIVIQWDDDDWHGRARISRQVAPIRAGIADITALRDAVVFDLPRWRFWLFSADLHRRSFVRDVHGGTLAFRRSVWERLARYPDRSLAEDAAFLDQSVRRGARLQSIGAAGLFVYVRHGANSWQLSESAGLGWQECDEPNFPPEDRRYYADRSDAAPVTAEAGCLPPVTAIMPTCNRREFVAQSIEYFRRQDYPAKELVIVDDGEDCIADLVPDDPSIVYRRLDERLVLGAKRNLACQIASGTYIAHWDDDDWQAPSRLSLQVSALTGSGSDLCGTAALNFYDLSNSSAWRYVWPRRGRIWAAGSSLCYNKNLWQRSPFPAVATGEDSRFVWSAAVGSMCDVSDANCLVGIIHRRNTVPKTVHGAHWNRLPTEEVEQLLGPDLSFYRGTP